MTHNIFGLNYDMERVDAAIREEDPDIVALQEYLPRAGGARHLLLVTRYPYSSAARAASGPTSGSTRRSRSRRRWRTATAPPNAQGTQRTAHIIAAFTLSTGTTFTVMTTHMDWPVPVERQRDGVRGGWPRR